MLKHLSRLWFIPLIIIALLHPQTALAQFSNPNIAYEVSKIAAQGDGQQTTYRFSQTLEEPLTFTLSNQPEDITDPYDYNGLAIYLGLAPAIKVMSSGKIKPLKFKKNAPIISDGQWTGYKARFRTVLIKADGATITATPQKLTAMWPVGVTAELTILTGHQDTSEPPLNQNSFDIRRVQYSHLPRWLGALCRGVEWIYKTIQSVTGLSWGLSLILFAVIIKLLMLPFSILTTRSQDKVNLHKAALEPIFDEIKKSFKGETAHNKIMAAYKARGITPYYTLKPLIATMISLPVLIAIFNMLGEFAPLQSASFLWMHSLAYPDDIATLPFKIPLLGQALNIMPFLMAGVTIFATLRNKNATATPREMVKQKRNLYLMAGLFFFIFYPFPSGMVFYWTLYNLLQIGVNPILERLKTKTPLAK